MLELLLLLLPVAAASGWYLARRGERSSAPASGWNLSPDYFKGLNYLLNEQPDKAIEVFIKLLEVDSETVETHLALGNLFRRRGEVDRAIRIHQNIIARPTLSKQQRAHALYELGLDYMRAGLLDRAENLFQELINIGEYTEQALHQLIDIYQQEKDWEKAIEATQRLESVTGKQMKDIIAQYYCELAEEARNKNNTVLAKQMVKRALSNDRNCVRASIIQGEMEIQNGDWKNSIRSFKRVEQQDPDYIAEIIEPLRECYRNTGRMGEFEQYLRDVLTKHGGITPMLALATILREQHGDREAIDFIIEQLGQRPSVRGLDMLIELHLAHTEGQARNNLLILNDLVKKLLEERTIYKCSKCGFSGMTIHWHCPSCNNWNSVKPIHGVVGE